MRSTSIPGTLFPQKKLSITDLRLIFLLHWSRLPSGQCWFRSEVACNEGNIQAFHRRNFWQHRRHLVVDEVKSRPIPASQGVLSGNEWKRWKLSYCQEKLYWFLNGLVWGKIYIGNSRFLVLHPNIWVVSSLHSILGIMWTSKTTWLWQSQTRISPL